MNFLRKIYLMPNRVVTILKNVPFSINILNDGIGSVGSTASETDVNGNSSGGFSGGDADAGTADNGNNDGGCWDNDGNNGSDVDILNLTKLYFANN